MLENKIGHDPVVTSSQENVMKCTTPEYPCKLHKRNLSLEIQNTFVYTFGLTFLSAVNFLISENDFLISENQYKFLISEINF